MELDKNWEIRENWEQTGLLEAAGDKTALAVLLQSQVDYNTIFCWGDDPLFNRISIPLLTRIYNRLQDEMLIITSGKTLSNYKTYKVRSYEQLPLASSRLDKECDFTVILSEELCEGILEDFPKGIILSHLEFKDGEVTINYAEVDHLVNLCGTI